MEGRSRGIPKRSAPQLTLTPQGVEGDFNRWRTEKAAGDPDQAVLLLEAEILEALAAEGWPVRPGDLGENVGIAGLERGALAPGARVTVGGVVLEVSKVCDPCIVLYGLPYVGAERGPAFVRTMKGRRGWFARVVRGGAIRVGDAVAIGGARDRGDADRPGLATRRPVTGTDRPRRGAGGGRNDDARRHSGPA
jgi:MOSC domain-containing protein YiiM